ncbi:helix-turn-helix domain-containing protein [Escherichia coli]
MNYSLKQLKVFVTVAQEKSFSRAGERIGLSQSAVSHSVKELEIILVFACWTEPRVKWCLQMQGSSWLCVLSDCWMNLTARCAIPGVWGNN